MTRWVLCLAALALVACKDRHRRPSGPPVLVGQPDPNAPGGAEGADRALNFAKAETPPPPQRMTDALEKTSQQYSRRIAVTIGIDEYEGQIPKLAAAVSDAKRMADLFRAMGYDEVMVLENRAANRSGILDMLERRLPLDVEKNDLVTIFFAGHGMTDADMGYIVPQDGTTSPNTQISVQQLKEVALRMKSRHVLFLVDACFSGSMFKRAEQVGEPNALAFWDAAANNRIIQIMTAGGPDQTVKEFDGWGAFTRVVHNGLQGSADENDDGVVTVAELARLVEKKVPEDTKGHQTPLWGNIEGSGMIALYDARRIPDKLRTAKTVRPLIKGMEEELKAVHLRMDRKDWPGAEKLVRDLAIKHSNVELNLLLAEIYLLQDGLGNARLIETELGRVEKGKPDTAQQKRMLDLRARAERAKRGPF